MDKAGTTIGLVIRSKPDTGKFSREQLDIALSAASLGFELELFFTGEGVMHLSPMHGHKGWKALPGLTETTAWVSGDSAMPFDKSGRVALLDARVSSRAEIAERLSRCDRTMVI